MQMIHLGREFFAIQSSLRNVELAILLLNTRCDSSSVRFFFETENAITAHHCDKMS